MDLSSGNQPRGATGSPCWCLSVGWQSRLSVLGGAAPVWLEPVVNPHALQRLESLGYETEGLRSKSWHEFATAGTPKFDFVFTVCDKRGGGGCPVWPGQPMTAHWGIADPAEAMGTPAEVSLAFKEAYRLLSQRIGVFTALPLRAPSAPALCSE